MTDQQLVQGCLEGSSKHQKMLFEKFSRPLFQVSRRYSKDTMDAEDVLQDAWIRIFKSLDKYQERGNLLAWMRKIVIHVALRKKERKWFENEKHDLENINPPRIEAKAISQMGAEEILGHVLGLPDGYKEVFKLFVIEGYSHKEIGELMNIKESTSRVKLSKARKRMQECINFSNKFYAYGS